MKILFCGTMLPDEVELTEKDVSAAGNRFQNNFIKNLRKLGYQVVELSYIGLNISEKSEKLLHFDSVSYVLKKDGMIKSVARYQQLLKEAVDDTDIVICYNIIYAWLVLPLYAKRKRKRSIAILADYSTSACYHSIVRKLYSRVQLWSMRRFSTVVGLSANIKSLLRENTQKFVLMEGGIEKSFYDRFTYMPHTKGTTVIFMYSGLLSPVTGVDLLLEAMRQVKVEDIKLVITGKGSLEEAVSLAAKEDNRIDFLGHLSYEQYIERLQQADVLVNPRNMTLLENKNNFPSKIMEYLATGKPIISTKFVGWEEFEGYITWCDSNSDDIARKLKQILLTYGIRESDSFCWRRSLARNFFWEKQIKKVIEDE